MPALEIGWPYFFRFSGVSGIGPLVVVVLVTDAPVEGSVVVTEVETAVPVSAAGGAAVSVGAAGSAEVVVVVVVDAPAEGCWA